MDTEVTKRLDRLCEQYRSAQLELASLKPQSNNTPRATRRSGIQARSVLGRLQERRKPSAAALVRLAYVRGMRSVDPEARLSSPHEAEVAQFELGLAKTLDDLEHTAMRSFNNSIRRACIAKTAPPDAQGFIHAVLAGSHEFALERSVRERLIPILISAEKAGSSAASYKP